MSLIKVYHGSSCEVSMPSLEYGRSDADFGIGFYVTPDLKMAKKWASRKKKTIVNEYALDTNNLKIYTFSLDKEWLDFVVQNRAGSDGMFPAGKFDLLIGATADDKLFATIEQYEDGFVDADTAVKMLNCMRVGNQICIRTEAGLKNLCFERSTELSAKQTANLRKTNEAERKIANQRTSDILRARNKNSK